MNPSAKLVHFSVCLIQNLSKLSISKSQNDHVRKLIFKSLFDILRRADIKEWEDENSIQNVLFEKIILLHRSQDNQDIIDNFLKEELTLMRKKGTNPFESLHVPSSSDIQRVRYILKRYPKKDLKKIIDQELIKKIIHSIDIILNTLSFQKHFHTTGLGNKDPYIAALEHQFSVYVELSYIDPSNSPTPFDLLPKLLDIGKQKKSKTRIIFEKIFIRNRRTEEDFISKFNDTRAQIIACLFTAKAGTDMHLEPYYEKFLEIFTTRSRRSVYYPISKTLLGTLNENEIPTWDHSSPLTNRLLKHKIFFSKDITIQTKYKFWSNLCEGNLEGKSTILIDALRVTYGNLLHIKNDQNNKNYQNWLTKEKILRELEKIGEVEYSGPSSGKLFGNPIVEDQTTMYARTTLEVIKNYRNVSLKDKNP
jgi:hypothetical protein